MKKGSRNAMKRDIHVGLLILYPLILPFNHVEFIITYGLITSEAETNSTGLGDLLKTLLVLRIRACLVVVPGSRQ